MAATDKIRKALQDVIKGLDIHTMVDAPCGDYYWLSTLDLGQHLSWYVGLDIVPEIITKNKQLWTTEKISFEATDLIRRVPPCADLILCRHLLIHLPFADCMSVLRNFKNSGSRYLMVTNQPQVERNEEINLTGSYRPLNLCLPPFNFPEPLQSVEDSRGGDDRSQAGIFELSTLKV